VNAWLSMVESEIRNTLAILLAQSVNELQKFKVDKIDSKSYAEWLDKYPVNQFSNIIFCEFF